jgi:hypothetical protein
MLGEQIRVQAQISCSHPKLTCSYECSSHLCLIRPLERSLVHRPENPLRPCNNTLLSYIGTHTFRCRQRIAA